MVKNNSSKKLLLGIGLSLMLLISSTAAFAHDYDRGGKHHEYVKAGHERYHYRDGKFYRPGWFGFEFVVVKPPIGVIVKVLPFGHKTIVVGGITYYYYDNIYYTAGPAGYMVVTAPVVTQPQALAGEKVTINVPNSNGSYTAVTLVRHNNGYVGPQGEYYPGHPTVEQLKALYGK